MYLFIYGTDFSFFPYQLLWSGEIIFLYQPTQQTTLILTVLTIVMREDIWPWLAVMTPNIVRCENFHLQSAFWVLILWFSCPDPSINDYGNVITSSAYTELPYMKAD